MAGHGSVRGHYLNPCLLIVIVKRTLGNKSQWNFNENEYVYIQENVYQNAMCKMMAILPQ